MPVRFGGAQVGPSVLLQPYLALLGPSLHQVLLDGVDAAPPDLVERLNSLMVRTSVHGLQGLQGC
jgi:hypothetical protein